MARLQSSRHSRDGRCEGSGDTLLVGGEAGGFHDDRVVELRVHLGVEEVDGKGY